jgi:hypothetical protein
MPTVLVSVNELFVVYKLTHLFGFAMGEFPNVFQNIENIAAIAFVADGFLLRFALRKGVAEIIAFAEGVLNPEFDYSINLP